MVNYATLYVLNDSCRQKNKDLEVIIRVWENIGMVYLCYKCITERKKILCIMTYAMGYTGICNIIKTS